MVGFEPTHADHNVLEVYHLPPSAPSAPPVPIVLGNIFPLFDQRLQSCDWSFQVSSGEPGWAGRALAAHLPGHGSQLPISLVQGSKQVFAIHLPLSMLPSVPVFRGWQRARWHLFLT